MGHLELQATDWQRIGNILETSFPDIALKVFVRENFADVSRGVPWSGAIEYDVSEVIKVANSRGRLDELLVRASSLRPYRPDLLALALHYSRQDGFRQSLAVHDLDVKQTLEGLTVAGDPFIEASRLAEWILAMERQVCLVRCGAQAGTGFLVSADLILTCYHVVEALFNKTMASPAQVRFDYRRIGNGIVPNYDDDWIGLDPAWVIPHAPYSPTDKPLSGDPQPNELDFALLRLAQPMGQMSAKNESKPRGWIDLAGALSPPAPSSPCLIPQHPMNALRPPPQLPLQVTFATPGYQGLNANGTRLLYGPSTLKGSSGSPVFDGKLRVFALHHNRGEYNPGAPNTLLNNRGIPLDRIVAALPSNVRARLVSPPP